MTMDVVVPFGKGDRDREWVSFLPSPAVHAHYAKFVLLETYHDDSHFLVFLLISFGILFLRWYFQTRLLFGHVCLDILFLSSIITGTYGNVGHSPI